MPPMVCAMPPFTHDVEIGSFHDMGEQRIRVSFKNGGANRSIDGGYGVFDINGARQLAKRLNAICDAVVPREPL
jgi:hypothetical protein